MNIQNMYNDERDNRNSKKQIKKTIKKQKIYVICTIFVILIIISAIIPKFFKKAPEKEKLKYGYGEESKQDKLKNEVVREKVVYKELNQINNKIQRLINNPNINPELILGYKTADFMEEESYLSGKIRIKRSFGKIVYIVVNKSFDEEIFNGIKIQDEQKEILRKLNETENILNSEFLDTLTIENDIMYVTIDTVNNIAVIVPKVNNSNELNMKLGNFNLHTKKYLEDGDIKQYISKVTDDLKEYAIFEYNSNYINLVYPSLGIEIYTTGNVKNLDEGINIYNQGEISTKLIEALKETEKNNNQIMQIGIRNGNLVTKFSRHIINSIVAIKDNGMKFNYNDSENEKSEERLKTFIENQNRDFDVAVGLANQTSVGEKLTKCVVFFKNSRENLEMYNLNQSQSADSIYLTNKYIYYSIENSGIYRIEPYSRSLKRITNGGKNLDIVMVKNNEIHLKNGQIIYDR